MSKRGVRAMTAYSNRCRVMGLKSGAIALGAIALLGGLLHAAEPSALPASQSAFLVHLDAALASRDPRQIVALADKKGWQSSGNPDISKLKMALPAGPLRREPTSPRTPLSVIYTDDNDRQWRLTLRFDPAEQTWKAVIRAQACPVAGTQSAEVGRPRGDHPTSTWTVLECAVLPLRQPTPPARPSGN